MRHITSIILFVCFFNLNGQTIEPSVDQYSSGKIHWQGQDLCDTTSNGSKFCFPTGNWTYWYENGNKMMELSHNFINKYISTSTKYVNMWLADGKQILMNGRGYYYSIDGGYEMKDSLVFEITDSIKNGSFNRYRLYKGSKYFLVETGQYTNSKMTGIFKFRDTLRLISEETLYDSENEICNYKFLHNNLMTREEGQRINGSNEGLWKYYTDKGFLWKKVNYKNGTKYGEYTEFYLNGQVSVIGQYKHTKGFVKAASFDAAGIEHLSNETRDNIPKKTGTWKYYNKTGKLVNTELHK